MKNKRVLCYVTYAFIPVIISIFFLIFIMLKNRYYELVYISFDSQSSISIGKLATKKPIDQIHAFGRYLFYFEDSKKLYDEIKCNDYYFGSIVGNSLVRDIRSDQYIFLKDSHYYGLRIIGDGYAAFGEVYAVALFYDANGISCDIATVFPMLSGKDPRSFLNFCEEKDSNTRENGTIMLTWDEMGCVDSFENLVRFYSNISEDIYYVDEENKCVYLRCYGTIFENNVKAKKKWSDYYSMIVDASDKGVVLTLTNELLEEELFVP